MAKKKGEKDDDGEDTATGEGMPDNASKFGVDDSKPPVDKVPMAGGHEHHVDHKPGEKG